MIIRIEIELLIIIIISLIIGAWFIWIKLSQKYYQRRYKKENDEGWKGEENRKRLIREGQPDPVRTIANEIAGSGNPVDDNKGQGEPEERGDLPPATSVSDGKTGSGSGKTRKFRNPFRRR